MDLDLEANLRALLRQDYDNYEVTFIVESTDDPAYPAIRRAMAEHPWVPARVVVAGRATDSGQKVHNLRWPRNISPDGSSTWRSSIPTLGPGRNGCGCSVSRLDQPGLGAVTGYRWFTPSRATVANALVYSMNCDVLSLLTRSSHYLIWGGSWAIRRDVFEAIGLHNAWKGTLSDDLVASRLMRQTRLEVRFEPACVVASPLDESLAKAMSFIRRQYLVARLYTFDWWLFSLLAATFSNLIWLGNLGVLIWSLLTGSPSPWIPIAISAVLYLVTVYRGCAAAGPGEGPTSRIGSGRRGGFGGSTSGPTPWWNWPIGSAWSVRVLAAASTGAAFVTALRPAARCARSFAAAEKRKRRQKIARSTARRAERGMRDEG